MTSLRGGVGYYYEPPNSLIYQQMVGVPPFAPVINLYNVVSPILTEARECQPVPRRLWSEYPGPGQLFLTNPHLHKYRIPIFACRWF